MKANGFFQELQKLIDSQPKLPLREANTENCVLSDNVFDSKNLYMCFDTVKSENSQYLFDSFMIVSSADCDYAVQSELCYESVDAFKCYNSNFLDNCARLRDSSYCYASWDGHHLFGCSNLRNKSFCIFNRQLTEEEYAKEIEKYRNLPHDQLVQMLEEVKKRYPVTQTNEARNENTPYGNYIYDNKNSYLLFDAGRDEECAYLFDTFDSKVCLDMTYASHDEVSYELVDGFYLFNCDYCVYSNYCHDSAYLFNCFNVKNSLGCVGLKHKQYCILNRQFTKEEYEKISNEILLEIKKTYHGWDGLQF